MLIVDGWITFILHFIITYSGYTDLLIRGITVFVRLLIGLPLFLVGISDAFSSVKKLSPKSDRID
ncbi:MAG: hypothetical protein ACFFFB_10265 [Candidatus Heimdallarchaeota archaeon]